MKRQHKELAEEWFSRARSDYQFAQAGDQETNQHHVTCFLCHQAAEKIFKGLLVLNGSPASKTHNLRLLLSQLNQSFPHLSDFQELINRLDAFYIPSRYPGPIEHEFTSQDAQEALSAIARLLRFLPTH